MRDDWEQTPDGFRVTSPRLGALAEVSWFHATTIAPATLCRVVRTEGGGPEIQVENPLGRTLTGVAVVARYEACEGKPGRRDLRHPIGTILPGKIGVAVVARTVEEPAAAGRPAAVFALDAVRVETDAPEVLLDLEAEAPVACPEPGRH